MKDDLFLPNAVRARFFRKRARSAFPQTETGEVFVDREGYTIVVFPENIYIEAKKMRVSRYGKRVILSPIKKKRTPVPAQRGLKDFRETVRLRAKRDPAFRARLGGYSRLKGIKQIKRRAPEI